MLVQSLISHLLEHFDFYGFFFTKPIKDPYLHQADADPVMNIFINQINYLDRSSNVWGVPRLVGAETVLASGAWAVAT